MSPWTKRRIQYLNPVDDRRSGYADIYERQNPDIAIMPSTDMRRVDDGSFALVEVWCPEYADGTPVSNNGSSCGFRTPEAAMAYVDHRLEKEP